MKRIFVIAAIMLFGAVQSSDACTNVLVSKGASADGSTMVTYADDSHTRFGELYFHPAQNWPEGSMIDVYDWGTSQFHGQMKQVPYTYQTVGNMNQYQVAITETTFGGIWLGNPDGMDYGSLLYITLQRAKSAREAIKVLDELMQEYGYASSGESFSISDPNEVWIMEMTGKGDEKGAVWVARRVPDGYICAHANQSRIHKFPLDDPENCLYSKDVITFARKNGFYSGEDKDFSFCDTYNPIKFGGMRGCEARVWSAYNILCDGEFEWMDENGKVRRESASSYLDFAMGNNPNHKMPLFVRPAQKVTLRALSDVMRDHYEGTPMDMTQDVGAGNNGLPYRWRPMSFEIDGKRYTHERAIATQQTGFWILCQSRSWLPDEIGGVIWFAVDDAATSALTPVYTNVTEVAECFREGNGNIVDYSPTSAFWQVTKVAHFAYLFYDRVQPVVYDAILKHETRSQEVVRATDAKALELLNAGNKAGALAAMTEASTMLSNEMFKRWKGLEIELLTKFMDGNVKIQNEDGSYKMRTPTSRIPVPPQNPPQRERWLRAIVNDHGSVIEVK